MTLIRMYICSFDLYIACNMCNYTNAKTYYCLQGQLFDMHIHAQSVLQRYTNLTLPLAHTNTFILILLDQL